MAALDVLPLDVAKRFLNIAPNLTDQDDELSVDFIPPAVERVERHVFGASPDGQPLGHLAPDTISASQRLACKVVLGEYWRTQRTVLGGGRPLGAVSGGADLDSDPAGTAPLRARLTELLGEPSKVTPGTPAPAGMFDPPQPWPDPALPDRRSWYCR